MTTAPKAASDVVRQALDHAAWIGHPVPDWIARPLLYDALTLDLIERQRRDFDVHGDPAIEHQLVVRVRLTISGIGEAIVAWMLAPHRPPTRPDYAAAIRAVTADYQARTAR